MRSTATLRFIEYARKSTDREDRQVKSLVDQTTILCELALKERLIVSERLEESRSAKTPDNRPLFAKMLKQIERGKADAILCWHINRLVRNRKEAGYIEWLLGEGIIRCIKTPEREYWPEDHAVLLAVETASATQYVRDLAHVVKRAVEEKAHRGWWPYRPKLGYQVNPITKNVEPDPIQFAHLKRGFELMLTESYTVPQVWDELRNAGFRVMSNSIKDGPRTKRPIALSTLYRIFRDPFYAGFFRYEGVLRLGNHQAMVSPTEFERVQRILSKSNHIQPKRHEFAYTGLIRCGACGGLVTAERKVKHYKQSGVERVYVYYHCIGRTGCRKTSVTESFIEERFFELLSRCRLNQDVAAWVNEALEGDKVRLVEVFDDADAEQETRLKAIKSRLNELYEMRENREITSQEFLTRKARYTDSIESLTLHLQTRVDRRRVLIEDAQRKIQDAVTILARFTDGLPRQRRQIAQEVGHRFVLTLGKGEPNLSVELHPVYDQIRLFEPQKDPPGMVQEGQPTLEILSWRTLLENIRNLIDDQCESNEPPTA